MKKKICLKEIPGGVKKQLSIQRDKNLSEKRPSKSNKKLVFGLTFGLLSGLFFAACAACAKSLKELDPGQIACIQYVAITVFALPMVVLSGANVLGPKPNTKYWLLVCGIFDAVTVYLSFISFRYLPLSDATVLTSTVPVFVTIASRIFLKEKCGNCQIIAIVVSVVGVALVTKVPLLIANRTDVYTRESVIGLLASLGSILAESIVYVIRRKLNDVNVYVILYNFGVVGTLISALLTLVFGEFSLVCCGINQWLFVFVGVFSFFSQLTLAKALKLEEAGPVSVLMAAGDVLLAFIFDIILFQDTPGGYTISGTFLVVSSVILVGVRKWLDGKFKKYFLNFKFM